VLPRELGPRGIRVNVVNPGVVETEGAISAGFFGSEFEKQLIAQAPLGGSRFSKVREDIKTWFDLLDLDDHVSFGGDA
jgi:NAD(P)-dependent dehydrogenase (short-subunit alcohol dehydrogenase family)